jgi:hypothetical protein
MADLPDGPLPDVVGALKLRFRAISEKASAASLTISRSTCMTASTRLDPCHNR